MKAVLMAAGVGSRISRNIDRPKCTLQVDGTPLIRRTVELLISNGIEVAVVVGYEKDFVKNALNGLDVKFYENPFYKVTNSMASLWFARDFIEGDIMFLNADVFWEQDLLDMIKKDSHPIIMLADESRVEKGDYFFEVKNGVITKYGKTLTREERTTEYVGIARILKEKTAEFKMNLCSMVDQGKYDLWWENVLYEHLSSSPIWVMDASDKFWAEIDYIDDYGRIKDYIATGKVSCKFN